LSFLVSITSVKGTSNDASISIRLNVSIIKITNNAKNEFIKIKYDSDQNRTENLNLKTQKVEDILQPEQQKNRN